jgi:MFS family permease
MCPPHIRGAVVSAKETVIVGGIVVGYAAGNWMSYSHGEWADLYGLSLVVAFPMLALTFMIPRSKRWLLLQGSEHRQEAYEVMKFIYKEQDGLDEEFQYLVSKLEKQSNTTQQGEKYGSDEDPCSLDTCFTDNDDSSVPPSLWSQKYRNAMIPSFGLIVLQQCSGQPSVLSYATVLFQVAGWSGNASVVTAILMMATSMATVLLVDRVGRRRLLSACCLIMMSASMTLAYSFWGWTSGDDDNDNTAFFDRQEQLTVLVAMFIYIGGYQVGFGPITWCIVSEIFPQEIRGPAIALGVELNYALNFLVQFLFPQLQESLGWGPCFGLFALILVIAFSFVEMMVPEMTGLTLEEIEQKLQGSSGDKSKLVVTEKLPLIASAL